MAAHEPHSPNLTRKHPTATIMISVAVESVQVMALRRTVGMARILIPIPTLPFRKPITAAVNRPTGTAMSIPVAPITVVLGLGAAMIMMPTLHFLKPNTAVTSRPTKALVVTPINRHTALIRVALNLLTTLHPIMEIPFATKVDVMKTRVTATEARISMRIDITAAPVKTARVLTIVTAAKRTSINMISIKETGLLSKIEAINQPIKVVKKIVHTIETIKRMTMA